MVRDARLRRAPHHEAAKHSPRGKRSPHPEERALARVSKNGHGSRALWRPAAALAASPPHPLHRSHWSPTVNAELTGFRHPGTPITRMLGNVAAPFELRDRFGGRSGPAGCCPDSRRAPAAYLPLRAGWALAPGHSGGSSSTRNPRAPNLPEGAGAKREGPFP